MKVKKKWEKIELQHNFLLFRESFDSEHHAWVKCIVQQFFQYDILLLFITGSACEIVEISNKMVHFLKLLNALRN